MTRKYKVSQKSVSILVPFTISSDKSHQSGYRLWDTLCEAIKLLSILHISQSVAEAKCPLPKDLTPSSKIIKILLKAEARYFGLSPSPAPHLTSARTLSEAVRKVNNWQETRGGATLGLTPEVSNDY